MSWQKILAEGFASSQDLLQFLHLPENIALTEPSVRFKTRVPRSFAERMEQGNPQDPLLLQVLAQKSELDTSPHYTADPLHEKEYNAIPGLIHKYKGRVLLTLTGTCAIHCRYCFRQHFPYNENNPGRQGFKSMTQYIHDHPSIHEVILSGGDPMLAKDISFNLLLNQLEAIPHVKTLRIHTRVPIVLPERLTQDWLNRLKASPLKKVMVLHTNHPNELSSPVQQACHALKEAGFHLLNQAVLLKGVNDQVDTLVHLSQRLFDFGIMPYYLHLLDKVQGAEHFDLPLQTSLALYRAIQAHLPGYLVPKLAKEEAGQPHKTLWV